MANNVTAAPSLSNIVDTNKRKQDKKSIFVTVGTTLFDPLVQTVSSSQFLESITKSEYGGYDAITVQYGKGQHVPFVDLPNGIVVKQADEEATDNDTEGADGVISRVVTFKDTSQQRQPQLNVATPKTPVRTIQCKAYRFKPNLQTDMSAASLILSHAGAGSIMEGLSVCSSATTEPIRKKLVVVINSKLMHNHQHELADALEKRGYLFVVRDPSNLIEERSDVVLKQMEGFVPKRYPGGNEHDFPNLLDEFMGFV